jgi:hypothetical protein
VALSNTQIALQHRAGLLFRGAQMQVRESDICLHTILQIPDM